ncbi:MAG TPA: hypothetical protein VFZ78_04210, partial [Flavisolibacter sp.]
FINVLRLFPQLDEWHRTLLQIQFAVNYTLLPLVTLLLAKGLGFIQSLHLRTQKDRIIPYVAGGIFYFWSWYVFRNQHFPEPIILFALAVFLSSSLGLIINNYIRLSMHAISVGVVAALFLVMAFSTYRNLGMYVSVAFLLGGLVCTARLLLSDHSPAEVYAGLVTGIAAVLISLPFV